MDGGRGEKTINNGHRVPPTFSCGGDQAPAIRDRLVDGNNSSGETVMQIDVQPSLQLCPSPALRKVGYAFTDLAQGQDAEIKQRFVGRFHPFHDAWLRFQLDEL